jgi:hypothetical protein
MAAPRPRRRKQKFTLALGVQSRTQKIAAMHTGLESLRLACAYSSLANSPSYHHGAKRPSPWLFHQFWPVAVLRKVRESGQTDAAFGHAVRAAIHVRCCSQCGLDSCSRICVHSICAVGGSTSAIERLLVPGSTELPGCHSVTKCVSPALTQLPKHATPTSVFINAPHVPVRCGLLFGLPTRRLRDRGTARAFRSMRRRGFVVAARAHRPPQAYLLRGLPLCPTTSLDSRAPLLRAWPCRCVTTTSH